MSKGKRTAVPGYPNIYRYDATGVLEAEVRVTGCPRQRPMRFPPETSLDYIAERLAVTAKDLRAEAKAFGELAPVDRRRAVGTLEGDAPHYWSQTSGLVGFKANRSHLRAWFDVVVDGVCLGSLPRGQITRQHVNQAITLWQTTLSPHAIRKVRVGGYAREAVTVDSFTIAPTTVRAHDRTGPQAGAVQSYTRQGSTLAAHARAAHQVGAYVRTAPATSGTLVAARTIRHRCRVLKDLYHTLDGKTAPTPVDDAKIPKRPKTPPVIVPAPVIETTLVNLGRLDQKTFGQFAVVATSAQRPCQVGRARPEDVDVVSRVWFVRDAKGEPAHSITLDDPQVAAWEAFIVADAWGPIDTSKYGRLIHAAGWPKGIRPYAARHSFAVNAIRQGVNLGDLQALLGHNDPSTTRIYAPFVVDRQREVSAKVKDYLATVFHLRLVKG